MQPSGVKHLPPCSLRGAETGPGSDRYPCASPHLEAEGQHIQAAPSGGKTCSGEWCRTYCHVMNLEKRTPAAERVPDLRGLLTRAKNFAGAVASHVTSGLKTVSEEEYQERLAICRACPFLSGNTCTKCGCAVGGDMLAKARWAAQECPEGKWGAAL